MNETPPARSGKPSLNAPVIGLGAVTVAGLAIAVAVWAGNAPPTATACAAQPERAKRIDAAAVGELAALNGTGTGRGYADLGFIDETGAKKTIGDFAGKTLLVNLWASWCVPCRAEMPALDRLATAENDENFLMLPINFDLGDDGIDKARAFIAETGLKNVPLYADPTLGVLKQLQTQAVTAGLPTTLLLDEKGCELGVLQGPAEWDSPDGRGVIAALKAR